MTNHEGEERSRQVLAELPITDGQTIVTRVAVELVERWDGSMVIEVGSSWGSSEFDVASTSSERSTPVDEAFAKALTHALALAGWGIEASTLTWAETLERALD